MADSLEGPGPDAPPADDGQRDWGRVLDGLGIVAGVILVVIVADIVSDGRLISRRLHRGGGEPSDERDVS